MNFKLQTSQTCSLFCSVQFKMVYGLWLGHSNSKRDPGTWAQLGEIISGGAFLFLQTWVSIHNFSRFILAMYLLRMIHKVEKNLESSLDSVPWPSPLVKIQIMGGKACVRWKGKSLLGVVNKLLKTKSFLTSPSNVLPYYLK